MISYFYSGFICTTYGKLNCKRFKISIYIEESGKSHFHLSKCECTFNVLKCRFSKQILSVTKAKVNCKNGIKFGRIGKSHQIMNEVYFYVCTKEMEIGNQIQIHQNSFFKLEKKIWVTILHFNLF